jgi:hypothetical protein
MTAGAFRRNPVDQARVLTLLAAMRGPRQGRWLLVLLPAAYLNSCRSNLRKRTAHLEERWVARSGEPQERRYIRQRQVLSGGQVFD